MTLVRWAIGPALLLVCSLALAQSPQTKTRGAEKPPEEPPIPLVRLAAQATKPPVSALKYRLLPDPLDQVEGNAAPFWLRASLAARGVRHKWTEKQWDWSGAEATPLDRLPRKEVKEVLDKYAGVLRLVDQAAMRSRCDWGRPPLTMQSLNDIPFDEIQAMRELANLINLRCRLALAEKDFDRAWHSLQSGFVLARHVGPSDLLIQDLVAMAIAAIMLGRVEEWQQVPGSPNLYWPLTELPRPLIDVRRSVRSELGTIYRSFPQLRELKSRTVSADEARVLAEKFFELVAQFSGEQPAVPGWLKKFSTTGITLTYYPQAKKGLIARGRTAKEVEAMPAVQAVAVYYLEEYDRVRDEVLKWLVVPSWQGREPLEKLEKEMRKKAREDGNFLISLLVPALLKVHYAQLRTERTVAGLRGAEMLRLYAARHGGKAPARWADITEVPTPIDPFTGKGLADFYRFEAGKGTLTIPPPPGQTSRLGRRFELAGKT